MHPVRAKESVGEDTPVVLIVHAVQEAQRVHAFPRMLWRGSVRCVIPLQGAFHGVLGYCFFGGIEDIGGRAAGSLGRGGGAVDGAEEDGAVEEGGVCAGG